MKPEPITHYTVEAGRVTLHNWAGAVGAWEPTIGDLEALTRATAEAADILAAADQLRAQLISADRIVDAADSNTIWVAAGEIAEQIITGAESIDTTGRERVKAQIAEAVATVDELADATQRFRDLTEPIAAQWWCLIMRKATGHKVKAKDRPAWMTWGTLVQVVEGLRSIPLAPGARDRHTT